MGVRKLVIGELRNLVLIWAATGVRIETRQIIALILARIAREAGKGGEHGNHAAATLSALLEELGKFVIQILREMNPPARAAMALVCARTSFAESMVVQLVEPDLRPAVVSAFAGDVAGYDTVIDAVEDELLGTV